MNNKTKELINRAKDEIMKETEATDPDKIYERLVELVAYECVDMVDYRTGDEILSRYGIICKSRF